MVAGLLTCVSVAATILGAENAPSSAQVLSAVVAGLASGATAFLNAASKDLKKMPLGQNERFGTSQQHGTRSFVASLDPGRLASASAMPSEV